MSDSLNWSLLVDAVSGNLKSEFLATVLGVVGMVAVAGFLVPLYLRALKSIIENKNSLKLLEDSASLTSRYISGLLGVVLDSRSKEVRKTTIIELEKERDDARSLLSLARSELDRLSVIALDRSDPDSGDKWKDAFATSQMRLLAESDRLRNRSTTNLAFGLGFSIFSVVALGVLLFWLTPVLSTNTFSEFATVFFPRLTIVLLVQLTASFFLRMHASNESDIKQNKNEITNLELRYAGACLKSGGTEFSSLAESLMNEERNFILNKDQKVAGATRAISVETIQGLLEKLVERK
ncbi:hypothetical protein HKX54_07550 [Sulfitobacter sp. M57]|uniref:hypothetical protein n=1 Tax=unclassified Sulfitobacter TaxID=196795 RepID=UPI0023E09857|nr:MULTISPECIES: hypothetical protein [unclassified Sulfitobacter]MDF3414307.1 hypothetical protein [Sulfitobacter sp. KE5]MDF3420411.1 hypothetical protein [Sulfitobacter sp. KE43]MDF3432853.1 hypothetical protein [Sulfitobacter sp. KE42]MDF3458493.1 hypothetical protein [Sulfitobacter sp. S74]MDF3462393.1 hypothetical protein [Sulfitobacter sp. Ks18]